MLIQRDYIGTQEVSERAKKEKAIEMAKEMLLDNEPMGRIIKYKINWKRNKRNQALNKKLIKNYLPANVIWNQY